MMRVTTHSLIFPLSLTSLYATAPPLTYLLFSPSHSLPNLNLVAPPQLISMGRSNFQHTPAIVKACKCVIKKVPWAWTWNSPNEHSAWVHQNPVGKSYQLANKNEGLPSALGQMMKKEQDRKRSIRSMSVTKA